MIISITESQPTQAKTPPSPNTFYNHAGTLIDNGYEVLPIGPGVKWPQEYVLTVDKNGRHGEWKNALRWEQKAYDPENTKLWPECGIGIRTGKVVAIDIDILDPHHAGIAANKFIEILGETPLIRVWKFPKRQLIYRTDTPFSKMVMGKIEVLAQGQQFVAYGLHPDTQQPTQWIGDGSPEDTPLDKLPLVTEDQVRNALTEVDSMMPSELRGGDLKRGIYNHTQADVIETMVRGTEAGLREIMPYLPNSNLHWNDWNRFGMLLYAATGGSELGFELFDKFSQQSPKYDANATLDRWNTLHTSPPTRSPGMRGLCHVAKDYGWVDTGIHTYADMADDKTIDELMKKMGVGAPAWQRPEVAAAHVEGNNGIVMPGVLANSNLSTEQAAATGTAAVTPKPTPLPPQEAGRGKFYLLDKPTPFKHEPELVRNLIPQRTVGFLGGGSGAGKSFLMIELAVSIATGADFVGHKVEQKGGVIIVAAEGGHTLEDRMRAKRLIMSDPNITLPIAVVDGVAPILNPADWANLAQKIEGAMSALKSSYGVRTVLIIIDTVSAAGMIAPDSENDPGSWSLLFAHMNDLVQANGFTAVLVHHYGKSEDAGLRGSSNARAGADFVLALTCKRNENTGDASNRVLAITKSRSGKEGPISGVELKEVGIGSRPDGSPVTSCVLEFTPYQRTQAQKPSGRPSQNVRLVGDAFDEVSLKLATDYSVRGDGPTVKAVTYEDLIAEVSARSTEGAEADKGKRRKAVRRQLDGVLSNPSNGFASFGDGAEKMVWRTTDEKSGVLQKMIHATAA